MRKAGENQPDGGELPLFPVTLEDQMDKLWNSSERGKFIEILIITAKMPYPDASFADLYDKTTMPLELWKAHQLDDKAVMIGYGLWEKLYDEPACAVGMMKMYLNWRLTSITTTVKLYTWRGGGLSLGNCKTQNELSENYGRKMKNKVDFLKWLMDFSTFARIL